MFWLEIALGFVLAVGMMAGGMVGVFVGVVVMSCCALSGRKSECERCEARQLWDAAHGHAWEAGSE